MCFGVFASMISEGGLKEKKKPMKHTVRCCEGLWNWGFVFHSFIQAKHKENINFPLDCGILIEKEKAWLTRFVIVDKDSAKVILKRKEGLILL